jgi:hypothetical protein
MADSSGGWAVGRLMGRKSDHSGISEPDYRRESGTQFPHKLDVVVDDEQRFFNFRIADQT